MSDIRRDREKSFTPLKSSTIVLRENSKDDNENYHPKRVNLTRSNDYSNSQRTSNLDAKVYVGNIPTDNITDSELLNFFKTFGKVSDIRVYKDYLFVQYDRIEDARTLTKEGQTNLILRGNKLDVLPAMDTSSKNRKLSLTERSSQEYKTFEEESSRKSRRHSDYDRQASNYEPPRKRYSSKNHLDDHHQQKSILNNNNNSNTYRDSNEITMGDDRRIYLSSSRCSNRVNRSTNNNSMDCFTRHDQSCYRILQGPENSRQLLDCQIIIVNPRQRNYAEEISSRLVGHGLVTSIILLREDFTLTQAIENATHEQCLYGIIAMPMHEERRTASFHILHGQTEEHRNLTLEDGYHIVLTNFTFYKERIRNDPINSYNNENLPSIVYSESKENLHKENSNSYIDSTLSIGDRLPLSMLLCLLADGRQLTLDEIDRILVYLLEKKAKMLTLPPGTLPPLPIQYANIKTNNQTGDGQSILPSDLSSTIAEQIRQILSTNIIKSSCFNSKEEFDIENRPIKNPVDSLSNTIKIEDKNLSKSNVNLNDERKDLNDYQQRFQCQIQSSGHQILSEENQNSLSYSYSKSNQNCPSLVSSGFNYSSSLSSSIPTNQNSFITSNYSLYDTYDKNLLIKSPLKQTTTQVTKSDIVGKSSEYSYPSTSMINQNLYQTMPNSAAAADAAAAIFQAYSQLNSRTTTMPSMINQQTNFQQQNRK
ncbi:unnamed protein product [Rotaria socialis]|uniref:RRM domain-containing protein n=1 Tax=Rotaria socialis TaxID=392032 RepID=A0A820EWQ4_9BILA|nr:unnamed protein product [Rotaria socialis]CAF3395920.1 unnamed protein product [Rotaria socialis]CAF3400978.1 unnamed protein product [Rotaria socialis]CAF3517165.1 unnamed protein product [Rotaria socialis]CAF3688120.1 unnamed protein product [Rotaria socialis]